MKTLFLFVPNYIYASDLLWTRKFLELLSGSFRLIIFLPPGMESREDPYPRMPNVEYLERALEFPKFWFLFGKLLRYSLIRKYDFEPVVQRNREKGMGDWRRRVLRFFSYLLPKSWITPDLFTGLEMRLVPRSKTFDDLVIKYSPAMVLTPSPGFTHYCAEAIILSKKAGIRTAAIDFSWDNLHNGGIHFRRPDYMIVWNEIIRDTAVHEYGFPQERVAVSGIMRFDQYFRDSGIEMSRTEFLVSKGLDPKEKTILLTTVTKGNYEDEHLILRDLIEARRQGKFGGFPNIFVRMHPKEDDSKFAEFMNSGLKNLRVEAAGTRRLSAVGAIEMTERDLANVKYTLKNCDVNINFASTITLEAFCFNKPVINISYPEKYSRVYNFRHYRPIITASAVRLSRNLDQLVDDINLDLNNPEKGRNQRMSILGTFVPFRDGLSYKRCADMISEFV
jgi:hypothetical protein